MGVAYQETFHMNTAKLDIDETTEQKIWKARNETPIIPEFASC